MLTSCRNNHPASHASGIVYNGDTVSVSAQSIVHSSIKLQAVELKNFSVAFHTTGTVKAISGQIAEIAPLFDGRITRSHIRLGQKVQAGAPLFELHSAEFTEAVKEYFQSLQTKKMKESNLHRQKDLVQNGVGVARELEETETEYEVALREYENAEARLAMLNINPREIRMGQALTVVSPIAGEVVQAHIVIGQYVKSDAEPLAIVADLSEVWVAAQVKEKDMASIHKDDHVEIRTDANPGQAITGNISHISELLDEETRSVQVLIACDNKDRQLKPGMFANVRFTSPPRESIVIPSTALLQDEGQSYVFVQEGEGRFIKRPVEAVTANQQEVWVTRGLKAGDVIIFEGGIYLMGS